MLIEPGHIQLSIAEQCELLSLPRSTYYHEPLPESPENLALMRLMDELHLKHPFYGSRQLTRVLRRLDYEVNRKRTQRLMRLMGLEAMYPRPRLSDPNPEHVIYPYLLANMSIFQPSQVWCSDITYIPMPSGFLYLVVVMDWFSRCVLSWELSNSLDADFCVEAVYRAIKSHGTPEIFNTDQGAQFTSKAFVGQLLAHKIQISMDGRARYLDNIFIERLWRTVKYEEVYLKGYSDGQEARSSLGVYFPFYNSERPHSIHEGRTPWEVFSCLD